MVTIFENCTIFDGSSSKLIENSSILVESDRIKEISVGRIKMAGARYVDCQHRVLMPGLIDAHIHAYTPTFSFYNNDRVPMSLMANHAAKILKGMLHRGFTTVRDAAGADRGLWLAIEEGLIQGPRLFYSGKAISQTGGHGDMRPGDVIEPCGCSGYSGLVSVVADGVDEVRKAVREELRQGAHQIKIFVSGGVTSPSDPIEMNQFTEQEIRVAVYEASTRNSYVMAHCHTQEAVRRCVEYGVRCIEHGSEIDDETAVMIAQKGVYVVPTLAVTDVLRKHGPQLGLPAMSLEKINGLYEKILSSIGACTRAGVKLGLGADLLGHDFHSFQGAELSLRGEVNAAVDVLRSATSINAEILQMSGELGCIKQGAYADILVVNGNPLEDLALFKEAEKNIPVVMKGGKFIRNTL